MNDGIKAYVDAHDRKGFVGRTNNDVYNDYVKFIEPYAKPESFRRFCKIFSALSGLTTVQKYARGGNVRVYAEKFEDSYDRGFNRFIDGKITGDFEDAITRDVYNDYVEMCDVEKFDILTFCEFPRRICARYDLTTKSIYRNGAYVRIFTRD